MMLQPAYQAAQCRRARQVAVVLPEAVVRGSLEKGGQKSGVIDINSDIVTTKLDPKSMKNELGASIPEIETRSALVSSIDTVAALFETQSFARQLEY